MKRFTACQSRRNLSSITHRPNCVEISGQQTRQRGAQAKVAPAAHFGRPAAGGFTIIECLIYISVLAVILGIGSMAFYRCWDDNKAITRNTEDIVQTLKAGELWRADVRQAAGPIQITTTNTQQTLRIPCKDGAFLYTFADGEMRRQAGTGPWRVLITRVKSSQMQIENRDNITAWRWELELQSGRKHAKVRPLFTFEAVAGKILAQ